MSLTAPLKCPCSSGFTKYGSLFASMGKLQLPPSQPSVARRPFQFSTFSWTLLRRWDAVLASNRTQRHAFNIDDIGAGSVCKGFRVALFAALPLRHNNNGMKLQMLTGTRCSRALLSP